MESQTRLPGGADLPRDFARNFQRSLRGVAGFIKVLRDAAIVGATIALLLYAAMTATKSMADVTRPGAEARAGSNCPPGAAAETEQCKDIVQVTRRED